ncbi:DUF5682 family protein [Clostridium sp. D43t1_170807_H7]|uniref:DUF5682 family protein n=1 Tax=Clostridium sp. D43t1_170807_H7 TaxID=2787140 RepID=UPI00189B23D7|nr:DUF5682 family protein [Clostridium sp. D43t1_170807_H7]
MEEILRSKEMDKINESEEIEYLFKKSFNFNSNIVFFPVRHHSPACSYHLKNVINKYNPEIILIEGIIDGNKIKEFLCDEESKAPFAIYYSYYDSKGYISDEKKRYKCYYPFLNYSPELVALREGKKRNIETEFIDLPYSEILIKCEEGKGLLKEQDKNNYNDDYLLEENKYIERLCEKQGCRSFNELWEKLFEIEGINISTEKFVMNMLSYCYLSRINTTREALIEDGCIEREIFMASKIQEHSEKKKRILVVTGGFHTYGIISLLDQKLKPKIHKFNKGDSNVYVMPYSMEACSMLNGYASGMPYPCFYETVWKGIEDKETNYYEKAVINSIVKTGKAARKADIGISTFDEICAFNMCKGLAQLRGKNQCGVYELVDSIISSFIKGELNISTESPLKILTKEITGKEIGVLCKDTEVPPIVTDFRNLSEKYKLKIGYTAEQELVLQIFSSQRHREISCFFHRMNYLETGFSKVVKGPNLLLKKNLNLVRESWKYKWSVSVDSTLIDKSVYGGTIKEAVITLIKKDIKENAKNSQDISRILVEAFEMGVSKIFEYSFSALKEAISNDGSFYSLVECLRNLNCIYSMKELYNIPSMDEVKNIIFSCYSKISILIPDLHHESEDNSQKTIEALKNIFNIVLSRQFKLDDNLFKEAIYSLLNYKECNEGIEGAALGILFGLNDINEKRICDAIEGYILGTKDMVLKVPTFLIGLFATAKDLVFIDFTILKSIDKLVNEVSDDEFIKVIPNLRLAFSYFTPREIDEIGEKVASIYGKSKKEFNEVHAINPKILSIATELDRYAIKVMKEGNLL